MISKNHKAAMLGRGIGICVAGGVITATILSVLLTVLLTKLILTGQIEDKNTGILISLIQGVSTLLGVLVAGILSKEKLLPVAGITSAGYLVLLMSIGIVILDGNIKNFLTCAVSILAGGTIAYFLLRKIKANRHSAAKYKH